MEQSDQQLDKKPSLNEDSAARNTNNQFSFMPIVIAVIVVLLVLEVGIYLVLKTNNFGQVSTMLKNTLNLSPTPVSSLQQRSQITPQPKHPIGIAFTRIAKGKDGNSQQDVWKVDIDGTNQTQVTHDGNIEQYYWLSNSNKIIYSSITYNPNFITAKIKLNDLATNKTQVIYSKPFSHKQEPTKNSAAILLQHNFAVSPDNKYIAMNEDFVDDGALLIDLNTGKQTNLFKNENVIKMIFSPDSKYLAVLANNYNKASTLYAQDLYLVSMTDQSSQKLSNSPEISSYASYAEDEASYKIFLNVLMALHFWSSDSKTFYFKDGTGQQAYTYNLSQFDIATRKIKHLKLDEGYSYNYLGISPDGSHIDGYFRSIYNVGLLSTFMRVNTQTGKQTNFINFLQNKVFDRLSTNDQWLYHPSEDKILYNLRDGIHVINSNMKDSTDKVLVDNASSPQWIY